MNSKIYLKQLIPDKWKQEFKIKLGAPHMYWSINNMRKNGFVAKQIIDVGAYKGEFTRDVLKIYPNASYLMLEANPQREADLQVFIKGEKK